MSLHLNSIDARGGRNSLKTRRFQFVVVSAALFARFFMI